MDPSFPPPVKYNIDSFQVVFSEYFYFNFSLNSAATRYRAIQPLHCPSEKNRFSDCLKLMRARHFMFPIIKMLRDNDRVATIQKSKREAPSI